MTRQSHEKIPRSSADATMSFVPSFKRQCDRRGSYTQPRVSQSIDINRDTSTRIQPSHPHTAPRLWTFTSTKSPTTHRLLARAFPLPTATTSLNTTCRPHTRRAARHCRPRSRRFESLRSPSTAKSLRFAVDHGDVATCHLPFLTQINILLRHTH